MEGTFARLVDTHVGMGTEVVTLGLEQVGRQALAAEAVVVGQRRGERRGSDAELDRRFDDVSPCVLCLFNRFFEVRIQQQVFKVGIGVERFLDPFEERRTDDATTSPEHRDRTEVELPVVGLRGCLHLDVALSVAADFRGVECLADLLDEFLFVAGVGARGAGQHLRGVDSLVLHRREASCVDGLRDQRAGDAEVQRELAHPLAGSLGSRGVEDQVDQGTFRFLRP